MIFILITRFVIGPAGTSLTKMADAVWTPLSPLGTVIIPGVEVPACFVDSLGMVQLRGHATMTIVPARGGGLIGALPVAQDGSCPCTPFPNQIILTTTALAELPESSPDVCIVRLLASMQVAADVNLDRVVDDTDTQLILSSPFFSVNASLATGCDGQPCGRVDVNNDGSVNMLDVTSVMQSLPNGTAVPCGALYATAFSCGSSRSAPLTPALQISMDAINFPNTGGQLSTASSLRRRDSENAIVKRHQWMLEEIVVELEHTKAEVAEMKQENAKKHLQQQQTAKDSAMSKIENTMFIAIAICLAAFMLLVLYKKSHSTQ